MSVVASRPGTGCRLLLALLSLAGSWASRPAAAAEPSFDYIVIGSGAGGGPVAARLALNGFRVLVLEAGGEIAEPKDAAARAASMSYFAPLMHAQATEAEETSWRYFVRHNQFDASDSKYDAEHRGLFYPRAATLGGCTAHHAMITVSPPDRDWDDLASAVNDPSWAGAAMRDFQRRVEICEYGPGANGPLKPVGWIYNLLTSGQVNPGRHGYAGWLPVSQASLPILLQDWPLLMSTARTWAETSGEEKRLGYRRSFTLADFDPNDWRTMHRSPTGFIRVPVSIGAGARRGTRERLLEVRAEHPDNLEIRTNCLATRLLLQPGEGGRGEPVARGVEYVAGERLYEADPRAEKDGEAAQARREAAQTQRVYAAREVIVSCGAFNTPQLLMLSGIGPADQLRRVEEQRGTPFALKVVSEGVGRNLQDRYELGLTIKERNDWALLKGISVGTGRAWDPERGRAVPAQERDRAQDLSMQSWARRPGGVYATNGGIGAVIWRSETARREALQEGRDANDADPDLFMFTTPGWFRGYSVGWSTETLSEHKFLSWVILKARTRNTGRVTLNARDAASPFRRPQIDFRNFHNGRLDDPDLEALVDGVEYCRRMLQPEMSHACQYWPPPAKYPWESRSALAEFARREAWGHHASCTCPIGPDPRSLTASWSREHHYIPVLDSNFRVWGVRHLRVVDASVFPRIPGYFILLPTYMISEKAAQVITDEARGERGGIRSGAVTAQR